MISICIPSYNRPRELLRLLNTIKDQSGDFEVIIAEDFAPNRSQVEGVVREFLSENPELLVTLNLNEVNLGYDGNWRNLLRISRGDYCLFMGDDDLMKEGALLKIENVIKKYPDIGFILRSWDEVDMDGNLILIQKYYTDSKLFLAGEDSVVDFFRKSVFFSGLVVHRQSALKFDTDQFDGKLLYQLYLLANILLEKPGYYISNIIATHVKGGDHFFGSSDKEKKLFEPKKLTIQHSLNFMQGFIDIAKQIDISRGTSIENKVTRDLSKYSYGFLAVQRNNGIIVFLNYSIALWKMGFGRTIYFSIYVVMLSILGLKLSDKIVNKIKLNMRSIPKL